MSFQAEHDSDDEDAAPRGDKADKPKDRKRGSGGAGKGKDKRSAAPLNADESAKSPRVNKKARTDGDGAEKAEEGKDKTLGKNLGGLIGKKRKMRKAGGK